MQRETFSPSKKAGTLDLNSPSEAGVRRTLYCHGVPDLAFIYQDGTLYPQPCTLDHHRAGGDNHVLLV